MSVERWLHMSRRSLVTSNCGCLTATVVFIIPAPLVVFRSLETLNPGTTGRELNIMNMMIMLFCFLTMVVAYCKVLRIIHSQQLNVEALNASSHNFGKPVINLAKYRRSIITVLHILAVFSFCFLPYIISVGAYVRVGLNWETEIALSVSTVFLFLTSSVNPGLYLWRMSDVRNGVKQLFCSNN